jgi:hypothetical protein
MLEIVGRKFYTIHKIELEIGHWPKHKSPHCEATKRKRGEYFCFIGTEILFLHRA